MSEKPKSTAKKLPQRNRDLPATVGLVLEVRDELKADIRAIHAKFDAFAAKFDAIDAKFDSFDAKFDSMDAKFNAFDAKLLAMESKFEASFQELKGSIHRSQAILEAQHSENRIMYEALHGFVQRMDRMETRQDAQDSALRALARKS